MDRRRSVYRSPDILTVLSKIQNAPHTIVGLFALAVAGCALVSRYLPVTNHAVLLTAACSPYLMLCAPVSLILLILARRWILATAAGALTVAMVAIQLPLYLGSATDRPTSVGVRFMSANIDEGRADPGFLVRSAGAQADVVAFQELTPQEVGRLSAAGLDAALPYRWLDARGGANGVGLWSRFPIQAPRRIGGYTMASIGVKIMVPGVSPEPTVLVAHLPGPWPQPIDDWRRDIDRLRATLREAAAQAGGGAVVVAGDLNSTTDMRPFRGLLRDGYQDAAEQSGAGFQPTYPADTWLPPFLAIDHVLTRGCSARSLHTLRVPESDHRALLVTVQISRSSPRT